MLGDVSWTGWSSIKNVDIVRTSGRADGQHRADLEADFQNTYRIALGANYPLHGRAEVHVWSGLRPDTGQEFASRLTSLPDNDRTWFTLGTQWKPAREQTLELGLAYLYIPTTKINNNQTTTGLGSAATNHGTVTGDYDSSVWILGAQYSIAF
jgi:long-chain fatty acid transport protein